MKSTAACCKRILVILILLSTASGAIPQNDSDVRELVGFWEGEFMPGNNLIVILHFTKETDGGFSGRVLLFQGDTQIQDDPLDNTIMSNESWMTC